MLELSKGDIEPPIGENCELHEKIKSKRPEIRLDEIYRFTQL